MVTLRLVVAELARLSGGDVEFGCIGIVAESLSSLQGFALYGYEVLLI